MTNILRNAKVSDIALGDLMVKKSKSINPKKFPAETFDLYSVPSYSRRKPEVIQGGQIGSSKQLVHPNDVLLSKIVPHIRRAWVVETAGDNRQIASGEWIKFRTERADPAYLRNFLLSDVFHPRLMQTVSGVGGSLLRARPQEVAKIKIPLPSLPEQRRIAAILDKADALRQKRREAIAKLDQLLQSVFLEMFGDPLANPKEWPIVALAEVLEKVSDGTHHSPPLTETGIPYVTAKHVKVGRLDFETAPTFVTPEYHQAIYARCDPKAGDVLYIKDGATTGIAAINRFDFEFSMLSSVALLRPNETMINSDFLECWLNSPRSKSVIIQQMGGAAIKRLTLAKIKRIPIYLPPIDLQHKFAKIRSQLTEQTRLSASQSVAVNNLFLALQQRAFTGQL